MFLRFLRCRNEIFFFLFMVVKWCHDTQHNDIQHNDTQHKWIICNIQHNDIQYNKTAIMLNVIMLNVGFDLLSS